MKKQQTHTHLLQTGMTLFGEKGYHGTGIKEIVDALQIPKGSFYNYFKSKEHFASEIVAHYTGLIDNHWETCMASGPESDPLLMLQHCFERMISLQEEQPIQTGCLIGNLAGELAESSDLCRLALNNAKNAWCNRLASHLERAQEVGSARRDIPPEELAGFCWDAWEGALLRMKMEKSMVSIRKTIALLFEVFLRPPAR